jgi:anti-sigma factor RsiW
MSCDDVRALLDDSIDGALDEPTRAGVSEHLAACPACAAEERAERRLVSTIRGLPASIEPPAEVWQAIEGRLDSEPRRLWIGLAAASLLAVALTAGFWLRSGRGAAPAPAGEPAIARGGAVSPAAAEALVAVKRELRASLLERQEHLTPETRLVVERHLSIIERSIAEIELALARDPGSPELGRMLLAAHMRELDLLRRANRMTANP